MSAAEELAKVEVELVRLEKERDGLRLALGDPTLVTWTHERGPVPRRLTAFEAATVRRLDSLDSKVYQASLKRDDLFAAVLQEVAGIDGEPDDPELLLRAAMVIIHRLHRLTSMATPESKVVLKALLSYLKSLSED